VLFSVRRADLSSAGVPIFLVDDEEHAIFSPNLFASIFDELERANLCGVNGR
jgi:hypothetical protein